MEIIKSLSKFLDSTFLPHSFHSLEYSVFIFNVVLFYTNISGELLY